MNIIYEPKGRAAEYADLAANLYKGCPHRCFYCFAPGVTRTDRETFHSTIRLKKNIFERLAKDAAKLAGDQRNVLLSFTTDPYQKCEGDFGLTRTAIEILNAAGLGVTILTKAGDLARRDFDILAKYPKNEFAVTLTTDNPFISKKWEPGAADPATRLINLFIAHSKGIRTWVSLEPVLDPEAVYALIKHASNYVDLFKVGKLNHHPLAKTIDWPLFRRTVVELLDRLGCDYIIKKDLLEAS